jgi:hypothetical protein
MIQEIETIFFFTFSIFLFDILNISKEDLFSKIILNNVYAK